MEEVIEMMKKGVKFVAAALAFGVLTSTAFQGTNYLWSQAVKET